MLIEAGYDAEGLRTNAWWDPSGHKYKVYPTTDKRKVKKGKGARTFYFIETATDSKSVNRPWSTACVLIEKSTVLRYGGLWK